MAAKDPRSTRAWRALRDDVVNEEPVCWLRMVGCTYWSTTADHVIPYSVRPDLAMVRANLRGACAHCNSTRRATPINELVTMTTHEALTFFE